MNKKEYMKPAMRVVKIQHTGMLMTSNVRSLGSNLNDDEDLTDDFIFGGSDDGYIGGAR